MNTIERFSRLLGIDIRVPTDVGRRRIIPTSERLGDRFNTWKVGQRFRRKRARAARALNRRDA